MKDKINQEEIERREANRKTIATLLVFSVLGSGLVGFCITHTNVSQKEVHKPETVQYPVKNKTLLNNQQQKQR